MCALLLFLQLFEAEDGITLLLRGLFLLLVGRARGGYLHLLTEAVDAALSVNKAHFIGKEGVALGANVHVDGVLGACALKRAAASAGDGNGVPLGVDLGVHRGELYHITVFFAGSPSGEGG